MTQIPPDNGLQTLQSFPGRRRYLHPKAGEIPGKNDSSEEMEQESAWLGALSQEIPLHLSRYFPRFQVDIPPTPRETLESLQAIARRYLRHVYLGNI